MNWIPNLASLVIPGIWDFPPNGTPRGRGGVIPARNSSRRCPDNPGEEAPRAKAAHMAKSPHRFQLALTQSRKNKFRRYG
jgi:hypothetical protein